MWADKTGVGKPPLFLILNPGQQLVRQESGDTRFDWPFIFSQQQPSNTHIGVKPLRLQPFTPRTKLLSEIYFAVETWQHAFISRQTRIIGIVCHTRID